MRAAGKAKPGTWRRAGKTASMKPKPERLTPGRRWISPRECAALIGIHPQTCYDLISRRQIKAARLGRKVLIDRIALEEDLEAQISKGAKR